MKVYTLWIVLQMCFPFYTGAQDCPYEAYHYWADGATMAYASEDYAGANEQFRKAFARADFPLGVHLKLALKTALHTHDTIWAEYLMAQLAAGGVPLTYFDTLKGHSWYPEYASHFADFTTMYSEGFDHELRDKFLALCAMDSLVTDTFHLFRTGRIERSLQQLTNDARAVLEGLKMLIQEHGFPCEQNMGYCFVDGDIQSYPMVTLLHHIYQRGELFYKDRLSQLVCEGKLRPDDQVALSRIHGYGDSTGIEQEMRILYENYRQKE